MKHSDNLKIALSIGLLGSVITSTPLHAGPQTAPIDSYFISNGYTMLTTDAEGPSPGAGGQAFDAEYLLYKIEGNSLFIGLQSGFDLIDGHQVYGSKSYWAGDLALSFDGNAITGPANPTTMANSYEFGIDFGLFTADYDGNLVDTGSNTGLDAAGVYSVPDLGWNTNLVNSFENDSSPFAMDTASFLTALTLNDAGQTGSSYYRAVAFDLTGLGLGGLSDLTMDLHWTMSCGNDTINARQQISVPEPSIIWLLGSGLALVGLARRKKA